jgi:hypothetical protein
VQAAEHAVREVTVLDAVDDLRLAAVDGSLVRFRDRSGGLHAAEVEQTEGPVVPRELRPKDAAGTCDR